MTLSHTILAFLLDAPYTGYELSNFFGSQSINSFWKASHQQIYRELSRMEKLGWVGHELIEQQSKPNKKLFSITDKGRAEFQNWFMEPCSPTSVREDLLVKVLAGSHLPLEHLIEQIKARLNIHKGQLSCYEEQATQIKKRVKAAGTPNFAYFALRRGILYEIEWIKWCEEVLTELMAPSSSSKVISRKLPRMRTNTAKVSKHANY